MDKPNAEAITNMALAREALHEQIRSLSITNQIDYRLALSEIESIVNRYPMTGAIAVMAAMFVLVDEVSAEIDSKAEGGAVENS